MKKVTSATNMSVRCSSWMWNACNRKEDVTVSSCSVDDVESLQQDDDQWQCGRCGMPATGRQTSRSVLAVWTMSNACNRTTVSGCVDVEFSVRNVDSLQQEDTRSAAVDDEFSVRNVDSLQQEDGQLQWTMNSASGM